MLARIKQLLGGSPPPAAEITPLDYTDQTEAERATVAGKLQMSIAALAAAQADYRRVFDQLDPASHLAKTLSATAIRDREQEVTRLTADLARLDHEIVETASLAHQHAALRTALARLLAQRKRALPSDEDLDELLDGERVLERQLGELMQRTGDRALRKTRLSPFFELRKRLDDRIKRMDRLRLEAGLSRTEKVLIAAGQTARDARTSS
jgi:hypothetical protein